MSDWWSRKLSGEPARPLPRPIPGNSHPQVVEPPKPEVSVKATFTRAQDICPGCGGNNYFSMGQAKPRCYDCGYPVEQQSSGLTGSEAGPAKPARQVSTTGYQPGNIIGRVQ